MSIKSHWTALFNLHLASSVRCFISPLQGSLCFIFSYYPQLFTYSNDICLIHSLYTWLYFPFHFLNIRSLRCHLTPPGLDNGFVCLICPLPDTIITFSPSHTSNNWGRVMRKASLHPFLQGIVWPWWNNEIKPKTNQILASISILISSVFMMRAENSRAFKEFNLIISILFLYYW